MQKKIFIQSLKTAAKYHSDPTKIFYQLCHNKKYTLLLESSDIISPPKPLESIMIVDSALRISANNLCVAITALTANGHFLLSMIDKITSEKFNVISSKGKRKIFFSHLKNKLDEDKKLLQQSIFDIFRLLLNFFEKPMCNSKSFFLGGLFSYDIISSFEPVCRNKNKTNCPDFCFFLAESLIIINHKNCTTTVQINLFNNETTEKIRLTKRLSTLKNIINKSKKSIPAIIPEIISIHTDINDEEYIHIIKKMQSYIRKGEIFQVVPSRKFFLQCKQPLLAYHELKLNNPSPYMFFMQDKNFILFGASPESYLKYNAKTNIIELHPIAGTRPRGKNKNGTLNYDLDNRMELSLRTNQKELAEHLMLVDLARNDLAKVCITNSRYVSELMKVDKYSHVMHLVSRVVGKLKPSLDVFHAYQACMNMGTLTGAPKLRAMQLISKFEKTARGSYGGSIGYISGDGTLDMCIIIRAAYIENNIATVQTGAGIVYDSNPEEEVQESKNKASAVLSAILQSHQKRGDFYV